MADPTYKFCPQCATPLIEKQVAGAVRLACPACTFVNFLDPKVVVAVVVEHGGRVLLGRRNVEPARGAWSLLSGYVDRGEQVEDAARREVHEETNLEVNLGRLLGVYSTSGSPHVLIGYSAGVAGDVMAMQADSVELMDLAFFDPDNLPQLAFPGDEQVLRDWRKWRSEHGSV